MDAEWLRYRRRAGVAVGAGLRPDSRGVRGGIQDSGGPGGGRQGGRGRSSPGPSTTRPWRPLPRAGRGPPRPRGRRRDRRGRPGDGRIPRRRREGGRRRRRIPGGPRSGSRAMPARPGAADVGLFADVSRKASPRWRRSSAPPPSPSPRHASAWPSLRPAARRPWARPARRAHGAPQPPRLRRDAGTRGEPSIRAGSPLALVALDIDHFKSGQRLLGHAAGDAVAGAVADAVRGDGPPVRHRRKEGRGGIRGHLPAPPRTWPRGRRAHPQAGRDPAPGRGRRPPMGWTFSVSAGVAALLPGTSGPAMSGRADARSRGQARGPQPRGRLTSGRGASRPGWATGGISERPRGQ